MLNKLFLSLFIVIIVVTLAHSIEKTKPKTPVEITFFCRKIQPDNPYCIKWLESQQKLLEINSHLHHNIKEYCDSNPINPFCKGKKKININTFCSRIKPEDEVCKKWQILKQIELEIKGQLTEEIKNFCQLNPSHFYCK